MGNLRGGKPKNLDREFVRGDIFSAATLDGAKGNGSNWENQSLTDRLWVKNSGGRDGDIFGLDLNAWKTGKELRRQGTGNTNNIQLDEDDGLMRIG